MRDRGALAVGVAQQRDRQPVGVEHRVGLLLPALAGERLLEVAVPVEQADADDRDAEVAGRLEVVAGQDAEAAGVLRQHGGDAELGREVGDRGRPVAAAALVPAVLGEVALQVGPGHPEPLQEALVGGQLLEPGVADRAEQPHRVAPGRLPQLGVDLGEDVLGGRVPRPAQVAGELAQRSQGVGQDRTDREASDRTHERQRTADYLNDPITTRRLARCTHRRGSAESAWWESNGTSHGGSSRSASCEPESRAGSIRSWGVVVSRLAGARTSTTVGIPHAVGSRLAGARTSTTVGIPHAVGSRLAGARTSITAAFRTRWARGSLSLAPQPAAVPVGSESEATRRGRLRQPLEFASLVTWSVAFPFSMSCPWWTRAGRPPRRPWVRRSPCRRRCSARGTTSWARRSCSPHRTAAAGRRSGCAGSTAPSTGTRPG